MNLILFSLPGAGKGVQGDFLIERFKFSRISTGELLREQVEQNTPLGLIAQGYMETGELVPDEIIIDFVRVRISKLLAGTPLIFDGFPRTISQAEGLDRLMTSLNRRIERVIFLKVSDQVAIERMLGRGRADDTEETVVRRIENYHRETAPLIDYYRQRDLLIEVDGLGTPDEVHKRVVTSLGLLRSRRLSGS